MVDVRLINWMLATSPDSPTSITCPAWRSFGSQGGSKACHSDTQNCIFPMVEFICKPYSMHRLQIAPSCKV